ARHGSGRCARASFFPLTVIRRLPDEPHRFFDLEKNEAHMKLATVGKSHHVLPPAAWPNIHLADRIGDPRPAPPLPDVSRFRYHLPDQRTRRVVDPAHDDGRLGRGNLATHTHRDFPLRPGRGCNTARYASRLPRLAPET